MMDYAGPPGCVQARQPRLASAIYNRAKSETSQADTGVRLKAFKTEWSNTYFILIFLLPLVKSPKLLTLCP